MEIYNSTTQPPPSFLDKFHGENVDPWYSFWGFFFMRVVVVFLPIAFYFLLACCYFFISFLCRFGTRIGWPKLSKEEYDYLIDLPMNHPDLKRKRNKQPLLMVTTASVPFAPLSELKGSKMDQLPNLLNTHKTVGTLEELLIMP